MALGILLQSRSRRGRLVRVLGGTREPELGGRQEREPERDGRRVLVLGPHDRRVQGQGGQRVCTQGTGPLPRISHRPRSHHSQPRKQNFLHNSISILKRGVAAFKLKELKEIRGGTQILEEPKR